MSLMLTFNRGRCIMRVLFHWEWPPAESLNEPKSWSLGTRGRDWVLMGSSALDLASSAFDLSIGRSLSPFVAPFPPDFRCWLVSVRPHLVLSKVSNLKPNFFLSIYHFILPLWVEVVHVYYHSLSCDSFFSHVWYECTKISSFIVPSHPFWQRTPV